MAGLQRDETGQILFPWEALAKTEPVEPEPTIEEHLSDLAFLTTVEDRVEALTQIVDLLYKENLVLRDKISAVGRER